MDQWQLHDLIDRCREDMYAHNRMVNEAMKQRTVEEWEAIDAATAANAARKTMTRSQYDKLKGKKQ